MEEYSVDDQQRQLLPELAHPAPDGYMSMGEVAVLFGITTVDREAELGQRSVMSVLRELAIAPMTAQNPDGRRVPFISPQEANQVYRHFFPVQVPEEL